MLFRNIVLSALLVGLGAGLLFSVLQHWQITPIINAAEQYEQDEPTELTGHSTETEHQHHHHDAQAWQPTDGAERISYSVLSNTLSAIGFATLLLTFMAAARVLLQQPISLGQGALWGLAGFIAFFVAPGIGLPPEIPGMQAADLAQRQLWWFVTVCLSIAGLALLAFAHGVHRFGGLLALAIPHLLGAPTPAGDAISHPDPAIVATLKGLHQDFIWASGISNAVFWLTLGCLSAIAIRRWTLHEPE